MTWNIGQDVHLGFGARGGAGFIGKIISIDGEMVEIRNEKGKTYRGRVKLLSRV